MTHHDDVRVAAHDADRVLERLAFSHGGELGSIFRRNHPAAETVHRRLEGKAGARGRLIEQSRHDPVMVIGDATALHELLHRLGHLKQLAQSGHIKLLGFNHVM